MKQPLHVGRAPVSIEIRLAKASEVDRTGPKFSGRVLNNSGAPAAVERVQLCCFDAPFVQVSTRVAPDGSFEFAGIPPGKYGIGLKGRTTLYPAPSVIEIAADGVSGATIQATASFAPVTFSATVDGATPPRGFRATIVFSGVKGVTLISAEIKETTATASLPADNEYVVSLSNIPAGYTVKSITAGAINLSTGGRLGLPGNSFGDVRIVFTKIQ
jgi:hypothetical protein